MQSDENIEKFLSRLSSKEIRSYSKSEPSFRVLYYGGSSGSVPFTWESQPGTPKQYPILTSGPNSLPLPPLSPPPSYQFTPSPKTNTTPKKGAKPNLLFAVFPKLVRSKKNHASPSPLLSASLSWSSSCGSYSSSASTPLNSRSRRSWCLFRTRSNERFGVDEDDHDELKTSRIMDHEVPL